MLGMLSYVLLPYWVGLYAEVDKEGLTEGENVILHIVSKLLAKPKVIKASDEVVAGC
jgi:hypothetical protein